MSTIGARLAKLENRAPGAAKMIAVRVGSHTREEIDAVLSAAGYIDNEANFIVVFQTLYEQRDGSIAPDTGPPEILSICDLR